MDRRYYLAKLGIVIIALALAVAGVGMESGHTGHMTNTASHYNAPAQVQTAIWHTTKTAGRVLACLFSHGFQTLL